MLENNQINIMYYVKSSIRDKKYIPINIGLINKLIGKRIFFIRNEDKGMFSDVNNIRDLKEKNKIGAMGKDWFDIIVWEENDLKYFEYSGNWRDIYKHLKFKTLNIDYFSRGLNEIYTESLNNPELAIERHLMLIYDRDYIFYLNQSLDNYSEIIENALKQAKEDGIIDNLLNKYWSETFKKLKISNRKKIYLRTPK